LLARCALHASPPDIATARQRAENALKIARIHHLSDIIIASYHLLGQVEERSNAAEHALHYYQTAIETIEQVRASLLLDEFQIGFMENKLQIYEDAMRLCQRTTSPTQVLYTLNLTYNAPLINIALAGRLVAPARLHASPVATPASDTTHRAIMARLNDLREMWHWYQSKLEGPAHLDAGTPVIRSPENIQVMRERLHELEAEMTDLSHRRRVHTTALPEPATASPTEAYHLFGDAIAERFLERIQQRLQPHDVLLHYLAIEGQLHALIVTRDAIHLISHLAATAPLQRLMRSWRFHLEYLHLHRDAPQANLQIARNHMAHLYTALVAPIEQHLAVCQRLFLVVPPGWHDLPMSACFDGQRYLIERFELISLSAPEILLTDIPAHRDKPNALIIGYSDQGRLTQAIIEARQVATLLAPFFNTYVLLEDEATLQHLRTAIPNIHLLHFATHAAFRQDNPLFSWIRLSDARLTVADLYEITLPQRPLVTLSACETGRGQARGGGLLGMGRGFLAAGTSGLIVGLWKVDDHAAARLMADMYTPTTAAHILSAPSAALRHAQQQALRRNPHPFYWAGFIFIQG
jgi:CHAT domain-containing protein